MSVKQAPEDILKKYTEMGFKKMWINKEFQRFCSTVSSSEIMDLNLGHIIELRSYFPKYQTIPVLV